MATDIYIINSNIPIQNGQVVVQPMPGQVGMAGNTNQGSGGFVLSYRTADSEGRVTTATADQAQMQSGYRFRGELRDQAVPMTNQDTASAVGTDITLRYPAAGAGYSHVLEGISFGFATSPSGKADVRIEDGSGNVVFRQPVTGTGFNEARFRPERRGTPNTDLFIILSSGGLGVSGDVSALGHWLV